RAAHCRCGKMAHARISTYLPPDIDPTKAAIAYGCRALPKLNEELQSGVLLTRVKALVALCDLMHDPEHVYEAINIGCLASLKDLLRDTNDMVRIKTTEVLHIMATHNVGRWAAVSGNQCHTLEDGILKHDIINALSFLLNDSQSDCRRNLFLTFKHMAQVPSEQTRYRVGRWWVWPAGQARTLAWSNLLLSGKVISPELGQSWPSPGDLGVGGRLSQLSHEDPHADWG
ncbi:Radial spoke head 14, partial [Galemys pyrenaicus]